MPTDERSVYVLTVKQPWAWAIIHGGKDIENRSWKPRRPCRVLIHAGLTTDHDGLTFLRTMGIRRPRAFVHGAIIGIVDYTGWDADDRGSKIKLMTSWRVKGYYHWHFERPFPAKEPIPMRGQPAFFHPPVDWRESFRRTAR
jgi:hypothetical protein